MAAVDPERGWRLGRVGDSYKLEYRGYEKAPSTASQTAWAMLGLMAAGAGDHPALVRGVEYLLRTQASHGFWDEPYFTAVGSLACSICATTAIRASSRSGHWRASATCCAMAIAPSPGGSEVVAVLAVSGMDFEARIASGPGVETLYGIAMRHWRVCSTPGWRKAATASSASAWPAGSIPRCRRAP
jgi:hypothetical protein